MTKIKVDDRVRVYAYPSPPVTGIVRGISGAGDLAISFDQKFSHLVGRGGTVHPKQCRRLKPRAKAPEHPNIGSKCTIPNCPEQHDPAPTSDRVWYKFGSMTGTGTIKAVDLTPEQSEKHRKALDECFDKPPTYDQSQVEKAKRPKPREFWLFRLKPCTADSVWMAMSKPLRTAALPNEEFVKVREVLPDDKGEQGE